MQHSLFVIATLTSKPVHVLIEQSD